MFKRKTDRALPDEFDCKSGETEAAYQNRQNGVQPTFLSGGPVYPLPAPLLLRPVREDDHAFLDALYDSTRGDLKLKDTDPEFVGQLIKMQQQMQAHGFRNMHPEAEYMVLERHGERIGRLVLERDSRSARIVDIAIWPAAQNQGVGKTVLSALQAWAAARQLPLLLNVSKANQRARRLYLALGFQAGAADEVQQEMSWSAA